jgi:phage pi2 protein 07
MFAPNSIKTLISIKNYNQLDQNKEVSQKPPVVLDEFQKPNIKEGEEDALEDFNQKSSKDISERVINTRVLLKEIDNRISDLKKWKRHQRKELERNLAENKRLSTPISNENESVVIKQDDSYDQYIQKLEEMMNLYKTDLDEARKISRSHDSDYEKIMQDIGNKLSEREERIVELSDQLSIYETQKTINIHEKGLDFNSDIQVLKNSLDGLRKDFNQSLRRTNKGESNIDGIQWKEDDIENESLKGFIEKEKKEISNEQKYDFKEDLEEIDNELKELEEMLNSK